MIPYGRQSISEKDIESVVNILRSDFLTQGPTIEIFEEKVAMYCNAKYAVAVSNATAALHIACLSLGLSKSKTLWTSPNTFVASANCALYAGANIDFVDIDPNTYNISIEKLKQKLEIAKSNHCLPDILVPVHFSGLSCDMEKISKLSKEYNFQILEDASHAIGGDYQNKPVGNCEFSEAAVFSFHPVKIITTGEGGMVLTNREDLYEKLIRLRSHGITKNSKYMTHEADGSWYYQQVELGFNYRMTDIQAALGVSQMDRLKSFIERRTQLADRYDRILNNLPIKLPTRVPYAKSSWHLYVIRLNTSEIKKSHKEIFESMRQNGVGVQLHYIPVHTQPYYQNLGFKNGDFPESEKYYAEAISLPLYYDLKEEEQDRVVGILRSIINKQLQ